MCGIAGVLSAHPSSLDPGFADVLEHRGPDQRGWLLAGAQVESGSGRAPEARARARVLMIHHRLSILDLSDSGRQPMATPDGRYHLVFNGEIYNYIELRTELESQGVEFCGSSDSEVLLRSLERWGLEVLERLVGMFAFALYDHERRKLTLARDFFGIKPLYYAKTRGEDGERLAFASEIKALLELPELSREADRAALYEYLRFGVTDQSVRTCFRQVRQLLPGHVLEIDLDRPHDLRPRRYWRLTLGERFRGSEEDAVERTRELFFESIRQHLRSDVPVGSALSGGIDSSSIVAAVRHVEPEADIRTFSFVASEESVSEERWARAVGERVNAQMYFVRPAPDELIADLDELIRSQDEPFGSTSIYAQARVFRLAKENGIKVMLDGQGADELLGGYEFFYGARLGAMLARGELRRARRFARKIGARTGRRAWVEAGPFVVPSVLQEPMRRLIGRGSAPAWLNADWFLAEGAVMQPLPRRQGRDAFREELVTAVDTWLPKLLRYEDRNSMRYSIESRVPFLTPRVAEFFVSLPEEFLLAPDGTTKSVLRRAMRGLVPDPVLDRTDKIGFTTPERAWLEHLESSLEAIFDSRGGPIVGPELHRAWQQARASGGRVDARFWRCVNLARWAELRDVDLGGA